MKYLSITLLLLFMQMNLMSQTRQFEDVPKDILEHFNEMGTDTSIFLNKYEAAFLNAIFKDSLNGFDFTNKKVGFITAGSVRNKKKYFEEERTRFYNNSTTISSTLYIFNATQKKESGGYDAAIVYWSKFLLPVDKVVAILKRQH